jgi:hypothetical protein
MNVYPYDSRLLLTEYYIREVAEVTKVIIPKSNFRSRHRCNANAFI